MPYGTALRGLLGGQGAPVYFRVTSYTGNGTTQNINTGQNLAAGGLAWFKLASVAGSARITDSLRGVQKAIIPSTTNAEQADTQGVTAFNGNGVTIGTDVNYNNPGATLILFSWLEAAGYLDIRTRTGTGVAHTENHSLGAVPKLIITKCRNVTAEWAVYHASNGADPETDTLFLNRTDATADNNLYWNDAAPTSTQYTVGTSSDTNANGDAYIDYLFAEMAGQSKFGSYTGNGSTTGPTLNLGWDFGLNDLLIVKCTSTTGNWRMIYGLNTGTGATDDRSLLANTTAAAVTNNNLLAAVSGGVQIVTNTAEVNANGVSFIYAAFKGSV